MNHESEVRAVARSGDKGDGENLGSFMQTSFKRFYVDIPYG